MILTVNLSLILKPKQCNLLVKLFTYQQK